jgi:hypothetical protein
MAQTDGVESDLADPNPNIYAGKKLLWGILMVMTF